MVVPANSQISDLTVRNTATTNSNTGVKLTTPNAGTILENVRIDVTAIGGTNHRGIYASGGLGNPKLRGIYVEVSGASSQNWGYFNSAVVPTIENSTIMASGNDAVGLRFNGGGANITDSIISGSNGSNADGINTSNNGLNIIINRSSIMGDVSPAGSSIASTDVYNFRVGATLLQGDVDVTANNITCAQSYSGNATIYVDLVCP
jgi:hypothetical protein